jgi:PUA domain protein
MTDLRLRKRHRMRQKDIQAMAASIESALGTEVFGIDDTVDMAEAPGYEVVLVDGKVLAFVIGGTPFLTVRGLLEYGATKRFITVDMGAVRFVANGADIMGPGVTGVDPSLAEGDLVWIRDERNNRPLAVGRALLSADAIASKAKGKVAVSIHHVGDKLWQIDEMPRDSEDP